MKTLGEHALDRLLHLRDADGWWRAYRMAPGVCRDWVSALAGLAMVEVAQSAHFPPKRRVEASEIAAEIADNLLCAIRSAGGWGYNVVCACDADTTAAVVRLLIATDRKVPEPALRFLALHGDPETGYATFLGDDAEHGWQKPGTEVDGAVAVALFLAGKLTRDDLAVLWGRIAETQLTDGTFPSYWYSGRGVASFVAFDLWNHAGRPDPAPRPLAVSDRTPSDLAHYAMAARMCDGDNRYLDALLDRQIAPGRWPANADLHAPQGRAGPEYQGEMSYEGQGVMTAVACLRALAGSTVAAKSTVGTPAIAPSKDLRHAAALGQVAIASGMSKTAADIARRVTQELQSDLCHVPWPNSAASAFAKGYPVEFSAKLSRSHIPALRFAGETGDPGLRGGNRIRSAFDCLNRAATVLQVDDQMAEIVHALHPLIDAAETAPSAERFFVWAGLEMMEVEDTIRAGLKVYVNLALCEDRIGLATRLLDGFGGAASAGARDLDGIIGGTARAQEIGFAAVTGGRPVGKLYWELDGYDAAATRRAMDYVGLQDAPDMAPGIFGIVPDAVCAEWSSGLAVRIDPAKGLVPEMTLATETPGDIAFTPQHEEDCIATWAASEGWQTEAYDALRKAIGSASAAPRSLHTLTQKQDRREAALYLRPEGWFQNISAQNAPRLIAQNCPKETNHG